MAPVQPFYWHMDKQGQAYLSERHKEVQKTDRSHVFATLQPVYAKAQLCQDQGALDCPILRKAEKREGYWIM